MLLLGLMLVLLSRWAGGLPSGPVLESGLGPPGSGKLLASLVASQDKAVSNAATERTLEAAIGNWECPVFEKKYCKVEMLEELRGRLAYCRALAPFYALSTADDCIRPAGLGGTAFATSSALLRAKFDREVQEGQEGLASYVFSGRNLVNAVVMVISLALARLLWWGTSGLRRRWLQRLEDAMEQWGDNGYGR